MDRILVWDRIDAFVHDVHECRAGTIIIFLSLCLSAVLLLRALLGALNFVYIYFLRPGKNLRKFGRFAIVTGATDGIWQSLRL